MITEDQLQARMAGGSDKAIALIDAINKLRVIREGLEALELHGAADAAARAMVDLRRMLRLLQEEGA